MDDPPHDERHPDSAARSPREGPRPHAELAHELRTPLSAIAAAAEIMHEETLGPLGDERYRTYAAAIKDNARHALRVIEQTLGRDRPGESDRSKDAIADLVFTEIAIPDLYRSLATGVRALTDAAGIDLAIDMAPSLPRVVADQTTIRQILLNLLTNAVRATPPGGCITLKADWRSPAPLTLAVIDTGPGIEEALAAAIQSGLHDADSRRFAEGQGIGLPLARQLATANGATLSIDRVATGGTRVGISFSASSLVY